MPVSTVDWAKAGEIEAAATTANAIPANKRISVLLVGMRAPYRLEGGGEKANFLEKLDIWTV
jgi:hypothetical protein